MTKFIQRHVGVTPGLPWEAQRYALFVSYPCPFAHRALLARQVFNLTEILPVFACEPFPNERGWIIAPDADSASKNSNCITEFPFEIPSSEKANLQNICDIYSFFSKNHGEYNGAPSVPILFDTQTHSVVNNESAELWDMFESAHTTESGKQSQISAPLFNLTTIDKKTVDKSIEFISGNILFPSLKCGFVDNQSLYDENIDILAKGLATLETTLSNQKYISGDHISKSDFFTFPSMIRFDPIYSHLHRCIFSIEKDFPSIYSWLKRMYSQPPVANTVYMESYLGVYQNKKLNPRGILPRVRQYSFLS